MACNEQARNEQARNEQARNEQARNEHTSLPLHYAFRFSVSSV